MADNYLEKREREIAERGRRTTAQRPSLDVLLTRNRSYRAFNKDYVVHRIQMESIVAVNSKLASGMNAQRLRFKIVTKGEESASLLPLLKMGAALPQLHLPPEGNEPEAFIVVCSTCGENPVVDIDLGISLQSMLLKAVEMGLGGVIVRNFSPSKVRETLNLPLEPLAVLAIGKPAEKVETVPAHPGDSLNYYRENGVHFVPKLELKDILI